MGSNTPSTESQQQYCLRWNNYQNNLVNVFDQLLQTEAFVDVTLSAEGHTLKAHKIVLSACSPYFQALFFDNPCKHPIVILNGVKWCQLKALTEFMYRGEINVAHDQLGPLLQVAELLKIRGLADVSHSRTALTSTTSSQSSSTPIPLHDPLDKRPNPADFLSHSNHSQSESESPCVNGHSHTTTSKRKRRKLSTPERSPSPPIPQDHNGGDDDSISVPEAEDVLDDVSMSVNPIPSSVPSAADLQRVLGSNHAAIGPALLNLHAAAAAMAVSASGAAPGTTSTLGPSSSSSTATGDMDIKPGIVEMIREEERAKMLESAHGWLGPGGSTLSDSYQYQIQNLWQKCWNQNQGGMMHALRFRERGPLKSWRPETMAEAIFAVLREGLSLSQAARKYDIPYPTFVLYANRVHNMLGPSADGSSSSDLMSDMRPKGRGRPQRILLGTWPEEHIRGVIRAVVFRDTQSKDDIPFVFNRDGTLCFPQPPTGTNNPSTSTSTATSTPQNGLDMSLHAPYGFSSRCSPETSSINADSVSQSIPQNASSSSSNSSSPLQQALNTANFNLSLQAAQSQLLAFHHQAHSHFQKVQQQMQNPRKGGGGSEDPSHLSYLTGSKGKGQSFSLGNLTGFLNAGTKSNMEGIKDLFKASQEEADEGLDHSKDALDDPEGLEDEDDASNSHPTDLRCSPLDRANNNDKPSSVEDDTDIVPVGVVQVQMDQGIGKESKSAVSIDQATS